MVSKTGIVMWKATSSQPRKIRKKYLNAPLHRRQKDLTAPLSPELQREHGIKRLPVRKNDTVLIMRGSFKGHEGKVIKVDLKKRRIFVEGATRNKADGTPVPVPIYPSKVMITKLDLSDKRRSAIIKRKKPEEVVE